MKRYARREFMVRSARCRTADSSPGRGDAPRSRPADPPTASPPAARPSAATNPPVRETMKDFIHRIVRIAVVSAWTLWAGMALAADRPNILFLFADDQRPDTIAALGNPIIRTPNLDRLCRAGPVVHPCLHAGQFQRGDLRPVTRDVVVGPLAVPHGRATPLRHLARRLRPRRLHYLHDGQMARRRGVASGLLPKAPLPSSRAEWATPCRRSSAT